MNTIKINNYSANNKRTDDTLNAEEWNSISNAVADTTYTINNIIDEINSDFINRNLIQSLLSDLINGLQDQVDSMISGTSTISLTSSSNVFTVGEKTFTLTANTSIAAENIVIKLGDNIVATGSGKTLTQLITVEQTTAGNIIYTAEFMFAGDNKRTTNITIYFVNNIYVGSGSTYTDVIVDTNVLTARRSPIGTYNVTVSEDGQYIFFIVPSTMNINTNNITLSGFKFPTNSPDIITIVDSYNDNISYKCYSSSNTNDAGTYQIVIS